MRFRRALVGVLVSLMTTTAVLAFAQPASAAMPPFCAEWDWDNGRQVHVTNDANGGGASVDATICWADKGNGAFIGLVVFEVTDTKANGAGATVRMEWTDYDGKTQYDVPLVSQRAWTAFETVKGDWGLDGVKNLYVRACLTNTTSEAHHCGAKA
jgi:hypothetical protein